MNTVVRLIGKIVGEANAEAAKRKVRIIKVRILVG
jgi:hypothetical protein